MRTILVVLAAFTVAAFPARPAPAEAVAAPTRRETAERIVRLLAAAEYHVVFEETFSDEMKTAVTPLKLARAIDPLRGRVGRLDHVMRVRETPVAAVPGVVRVEVLGAFELGALLFTITFDPAGKVAGLTVLPATGEELQDDPAAPETPGGAPSVHAEPGADVPFWSYQTKTRFRLPFRGEWVVANGGRARSVNHHMENANQRFGLDLLKMGSDGRTHRGEGTSNEEYYAWGEEVLAPAAGTVVQVVDGIEDSDPKRKNEYFVPGNMVVIDHGSSEYSFLAHFTPGSIRVRPGQKVVAGEVLGRCGNSGNSSESHIHFHVGNAPRIQDGAGLPIGFQPLVRNGTLQVGEAVRGDRMANPPETPPAAAPPAPADPPAP